MKLKPCSYFPNCVSTQSNSIFHSISPLNYQISAKQAMELLKNSALLLPRSLLVKETSHFLQFEFRSHFLGFIDDVEIIVDDSEKKIHFRSASRLGFSDFGVNRRRIKAIKQNFLKSLIK